MTDKTPNKTPQPGLIDVPIEYFARFQEDPESAARDWLALPSPAISPFFRDLSKISNCIKGYPNPIDWDTYALDSDLVAKNEHSRFIHCDLSINRDAAGLAMCHVPRYIELQIRTPEGSVQSQPMPVVQFDLVARLKPRPEFGEREIDYDAILGILLELRRRNFRIEKGLITFDRFQSHWMISTLRREGFICSLLSVDHTTSRVLVDWDKPPYYVAKEPLPREPAACYVLGREMMYQNRLLLPEIPLWVDGRTTWFEREALGTMWDGEKGKAGKAAGESDDLLQAILGAAFNAHNNAEKEPMSVEDSAKEIEQDTWYDTIADGSEILGIAKRDDIASGDELVDDDLGYVPDSSDVEFDAMQDRFNEIF